MTRRDRAALPPELPRDRLACPSASPEMPVSAILGVIKRYADGHRLAFLDQLEPVTSELLELAQPVAPTRIFRFSAPCVENGCAHFDGQNCRLAKRVVRRLPMAVDKLPNCALRSACRWWRQEGDAACLRCPMIVTESFGASEADDELRVVADPTTPV